LDPEPWTLYPKPWHIPCSGAAGRGRHRAGRRGGGFWVCRPRGADRFQETVRRGGRPRRPGTI